MADPRRLSLLIAITLAVTAAPSPAAFTADTLTPVPAEAMLAALDLDQGTPDPACVADLAAARDRSIASAEALMKARGFFSKFSSNCSEYGDRKCTAVRNSCQALCGPKPDDACLAACDATFQNCCYTGAVAFEEWWFGEKVKQCPKVATRMTPPAAEPRPATRDAGPTEPVDKKRALADMLQGVNKMVDALGPNIDALDTERFNSVRRTLAFAQVSVGLAQHGAKYALVSGGNGRLWIVGKDGMPHQVDQATAKLLRAPSVPNADIAAWQQAVVAGLGACGLDRTDAIPLINAANTGFGSLAFPAGDVLYFRDPLVASTEHFSIKGTINGGGDFI